LNASTKWGYGFLHSFVSFPNEEVRQKNKGDAPFYFAYIKGPNVEMIFGPGARKGTIWRHGESNKRHDWIGQKALLKSIGVDADNIKWVVIHCTSWGWAGGVSAFAETQSFVNRPSKATFVIQKKEFDTPSGYSDWSDIEKIEQLEKEGRLIIIDGDHKLAPGLTVHFIGGRTHGDQALSVNTEDGLVLLTGDSVYTYENLKYDIPGPFNVSAKNNKKGYKRVREILGESDALLVPGNDMEIFHRFPNFADRVVQIKLK
jgi:glyoxylase-like metal-dependent hydrolase (beta-lactamase superfamily II)